MQTADELALENRVLRERVAQLEATAGGQVDPVMLALIAHAPAFLTVVTPEGRFVATGRVSEGFGSVVGRSIFEFSDPRYVEVVRDALARACATRQPVAYEGIGYGENGEPDHTYAVRVIPIVDNGEVRVLVIVPLDITERVRLERSLIESEQSMRLALDAARMGLWRWDIVRDEVTWDARSLEIFGVAAAPSTREQYMQLIHPDDRALIEPMLLEALRQGVYPTFEHRIAAGTDGESRWALSSGKVLRDASGKPTLMLGGVLDITEQKRLAERMQRAERVEALGQLTAGIAHNFNNLLAAILPNVEIALFDASDRSQQPLNAALDASLQARELVKSLMSLAGRRGAQPKGPSDPKQIAVRLDNICQLTFPKEIELLTSIDPTVGLVAMPASDLEQVLLNLLFNARDAVLEADAGRRRIQLRVDRVAENTELGNVRIRVIDTGVGMTDAVRQLIFVPFFTTKPAHRGSGLGLANALSRVREAAGTLECQSSPGSGTTFTLSLPETAPGPARESPRSVTARTEGGGETILVVDDEPLVRAVVARLLRGEGYTALEAGSATEAREVLRQHGSSVRLMLLDQSMPGESGLEAVSSLRALCAAPIVLFTGLGIEIPEGVAALLDKPARPVELLRTVRAILD